MMLGLLFGSLIGGRLSDRFGRKLTMIVSMVIIIPSVMFGNYFFIIIYDIKSGFLFLKNHF